MDSFCLLCADGSVALQPPRSPVFAAWLLKQHSQELVLPSVLLVQDQGRFPRPKVPTGQPSAQQQSPSSRGWRARHPLQQPHGPLAALTKQQLCRYGKRCIVCWPQRVRVSKRSPASASSAGPASRWQASICIWCRFSSASVCAPAVHPT